MEDKHLNLAYTSWLSIQENMESHEVWGKL